MELKALKQKLLDKERENESLQQKILNNVNEATDLVMEMVSNNSISLKIRYEDLVRELPILSEKLTKIQEECHQLRIQIKGLE